MARGASDRLIVTDYRSVRNDVLERSAKESQSGAREKRRDTMLTVGDQFPSYKLKSVISMEKGKEFVDIEPSTHEGKWRVVFFWPMDFTFVCPTEIAAYSKKARDFRDREAEVLGVSTDT